MLLNIQQCTGPPTTIQNHLDQNVNSVEVEKPGHIIMEPNVTYPTQFSSCSLITLRFYHSEQFSNNTKRPRCCLLITQLGTTQHV